MSVQSQMVSLCKKEVVPQYEFEKGTWWRDGFWRYARFKNMPFILGSHVRGRYIWYSTVFFLTGNQLEDFRYMAGLKHVHNEAGT